MNTQLAAKLGAAVALALSGAAAAADWEFNPTIEAGYLFDDNYRLSAPGSEIEVQGPMADAALEMRALNPAGEFSFTPRVRATYFSDEPQLDSVDYFAGAYWLHQGQRLRTEINGLFAQQDVVNSEQPDATVPGGVDLGDPDLGDSGRALIENRRQRVTIIPTLSYEWSERRALEMNANFTDVSYDVQIPGAQVDYRNADLALGLLMRVSPTASLTTRVRGASYDLESIGDSSSYGVELQWDQRNATGTRSFIRIGAQNVDFQLRDTATAWLAGAGLRMDHGRNQLFFDLARSVGPSSAGVVITRDQLRLNYSRDLTPRLALITGLRGTHDEDVSDVTLYKPRTYATADIGLLWRWQEEFALRATYDYTWQDFDDSLLEAARSSGALLSVLYQPVQRRR